MPGARSMAIDTGLTARLRRQLGRGQLILFTGAGFSCGAFARSGRPIPTAEELKRELWRLAFPSKSVVDERSELGDVFELAVARAGNASRELLSDLLKVDVERSPDRFRAWFSLPWYRHYTLRALFKTPGDREEEKRAGGIECVMISGVWTAIVGVEHLPVLEVGYEPLDWCAKRRDLGVVFLVRQG